MSIYMSRLFPRSNSSFLLSNGNALQSQVLRLREETFLVDAGPGTPRICTQDELPNNRRAAGSSSVRSENKVGFLLNRSVGGGESQMLKGQMLERFFIDLVAGESVMKQRAAARFNELVGSSTDGDEIFLLPRRFRQNQARMELNKIWERNTKVKGFIIEKVKGGYSVAIAGFIAFLPFRPLMSQRISSNDRFIIEVINPQTNKIVVF